MDPRRDAVLTSRHERGRGLGAQVRDRSAVAINYHFLRGDQQGRFQLRSYERPERFEQQLRVLAENFTFCRVRDLVDPSVELPESNIVLSFDDGAKDVADHALASLARHGAKATIFVCAQPYLEGRLLEIQKIEFLMRRLGLEGFRGAFHAELESQFPGGVERESLEFAGGYPFYRYDEEPIREFKLDLNYRLPYGNVIPVLDALFRAVFGDGCEAEAVKETYLSVDDLARLRDAGHEIGVHTHRHRVLPRLDFDAQKREIQIGIEFLRETLGETRFTVAYPYGFHDARTRRAMQELGALAGVSMGRRRIGPDDIQARWSLPRYDVNDCFDRASNEIRSEIFSNASNGD